MVDDIYNAFFCFRTKVCVAQTLWQWYLPNYIQILAELLISVDWCSNIWRKIVDIESCLCSVPAPTVSLPHEGSSIQT